MHGCMFNIDSGYLEGLCRGFKSGILSQNDYLNLVQCETLEGMKFKLPPPHEFPLKWVLHNTLFQNIFRSEATSSVHRLWKLSCK